MKKTIQMNFTKSTKGTHVYSTDEIDSPVSSIYIKRAGLPTEPPRTISLSLEYDDESSSS